METMYLVVLLAAMIVAAPIVAVAKIEWLRYHHDLQRHAEAAETQNKRAKAKEIRRVLDLGNRLCNLLNEATRGKLRIQKRINSDWGRTLITVSDNSGELFEVSVYADFPEDHKLWVSGQPVNATDVLNGQSHFYLDNFDEVAAKLVKFVASRPAVAYTEAVR